MLMRHILLSGCLCWPLLCAGCLEQREVPALPETSGSTLSENGRLSFAYLQMEQAIQRGDLAGVLEAGNSLLELKGDLRPVSDAASWLLSSKQAAEAQKLLEKALLRAPQDPALRAMLIDSLLDQDKTAEARALVQSHVKENPRDMQARHELALLYLKTGENERALQELQKLPDRLRTPAVLYYQAQANHALGRNGEAARLLKEALNKAPDFLEAMLELAGIEEQLGHYGTARKLYEKLLTYDEGNQDILLRLAAIALKSGKADRAYELACSKPDSMTFILMVSSLFLEEKRLDLAEKLLENLSSRPDAPEELLFYRAALTYEGRRDAERTLALLDKVTPENRCFDRSLKLRAQVLFENGQTEKALQVIHRGHNVFPSDKDFIFFALDVLSRQERFEEALHHAAAALEDWPDDPDLLFQYASLTEQAGNQPEALRLMEELLQRHPDNVAVLNYIGYTLANENRDLPRALELLTKAVKLQPDADYVLDSLAWAYFRTGDYDKAWNYIQQAIDHMMLSPNHDPTMWEHYGDIACTQGRYAEARQAWNNALDLQPQNVEELHNKLDMLP